MWRPGFSAFGFSVEGFEPVRSDSVLDRAGVAALLDASADLADFVVYAEPPDTLSGPALVVSPRDPYQDYETFGTLTIRLAVSVLIPRTHGPAMDRIDSVLETMRGLFYKEGGIKELDTNIGLIDSVGGVEYIAAMVNLESS